MSDLSTRTVSISGAKAALRHAFKKQRPLFLWGPPGIGKSDLVHQLGSEMENCHVIDVRLSLWEPTDIKGIPFFNANDNTMSWAPPIELPSTELASNYKNIILFLDEMNSAPPSVQAAAYQLILNRKVGTYKLPDNVIIVAAGNREADKGVTYRMPAPLANRFVHMELRVDFDDWFSWAVDNKIHKDVVGYISFAKQDLYDFDPKTASRSFATPRSWSFVSELLDDDISEATLADLVSGAVGEGTGVKFMAHRKIAGRMPNPSDILSGKVKELKVKEISAMYSLTVSLCYELKDGAEKKIKNWDEQADNFFRFMMDNFETELVVMGAKVALTNYDLPLDPSKLKNFDEFHDRFGKYVIAANQ
jgi:ATPase family associated with various cellular activities (AAA)